MRADVASWLELDAHAIAANAAVYRGILGAGTRLGGVLKGNAYGHGLEQVLPMMHPVVDVLYVIAAPDALAIRAWEAHTGAARRQVVVIGVVSAAEAVALARAGVDLVLADAGWRPLAEAVAAEGLCLRVHAHIDSGLGREGVEPSVAAEVFGGVVDSAGVELVGVLTHFADTEDVTEHLYAREQLERFGEGVHALQPLVTSPLQRHAAASAAALVLPSSRLDVARVGIALYGLWPSRETRLSTQLVHGVLPELRPVLSWRSPTQLIKAVPEGAFVGYGCTHRTTRQTASAVLPVGYFDGYPRLLSGKAWVLVRGRRCQVMGRVMMNHVIVDVTGVAEPGEQVVATLIGDDGDERITADQVADWSQSINYEVVARLPAHLERRVVGSGESVG